jgi:hypothetical protein
MRGATWGNGTLCSSLDSGEAIFYGDLWRRLEFFYRVLPPQTTRINFSAPGFNIEETATTCPNFPTSLRVFIQFDCHASGNKHQVELDWVYVRPLIDPAPTVEKL